MSLHEATKSTPRPSPRPSPLDDLSPLARELREDFMKDTKTDADVLFSDMKSRVPIPGFGSKKEAISTDKVDDLQSQIGSHFNRLVDTVVGNFDRSLMLEDAKYRAELAQSKGNQTVATYLREKYTGRYGKLCALSAGELKALIQDVEDLGKSAKNPGEFVMTYFPQLEKMKIQEETRSYEDAEKILKEATKPGGEFDVEYVKDNYGKAQVMIDKLNDGKKLESADYDELLSQLTPLLGANYPTNDKGKLKTAIQGIKSGGAMTVLNVMTPVQRMEFGKYLAGKGGSPSKRRQGILSLASANYLTMSQAEAILGEHQELNGIAPEEKKQIEIAQKMYIELGKQAEKRMKTGSSSNLMDHYFTGSNALIYEVIGRMAIIGMVLSLALNLKNIPRTLCSPIFLAMAATAGFSFEHITGGVGKGAISRFIAGRQEVAPAKKDPDQAQTEELESLMSENLEGVKFLREKKGEQLSAILEIADIKSEKDPGAYRFTFDDLIEHQMEREDPGETWTAAKKAERKAELEAVYKKGLDGKTVSETETGIARIYQWMRRSMGLTQKEEMLAALETTDKSVGIG